MTTTPETRTSTSPRAMVEIIAEGLDATGVLPPYERLVELDELLRAELRRLVPIVQQRTDKLYRGGPQWYGQQRVLDGARHALMNGLGAGLRSAALQVHSLARYARWLAEYAEVQP
ncbi:DUF6415 family natural product biosynthesis protein [Streptomyces sp. O3]